MKRPVARNVSLIIIGLHTLSFRVLQSGCRHKCR